MILWTVAAGPVSTDQARRILETAPVVRRDDEYHSESLLITRVETDGAGIYYVVVETDCVFPEDVDALEDLGRKVGEPWRMQVLDTDVWMRPHPELAMSSSFQVHVVVPAALEGESRKTIIV